MNNQNNNPLVQTLKGFRDFLPEEKRKRDSIIAQIVKAFQLYGFEPLETPTLEYASLLLGKYGDEADKLVYTFRDQGDREVGLRYDQTVPTSRVLAQYGQELPKFFRRYQIQNVFRADKPQKGRFREFTQCDIDIFGTKSVIADAEIIACTYQAFKNLKFPDIKIKINDRQVLFSVLKPYETKQINVFSIIQSIDKLDKLSENQVIAELIKKSLTKEKAKQCLQDINNAKATENLSQIMQTAVDLGIDKEQLIFTPTLARGLDYYTGSIFEIIIPEYKVGSCAGGGRYDKLIEQLGGIDIPAVGLSFGLDRIVEAAEQFSLLANNQNSSQVLITMFDKSALEKTLNTANSLRKAGIQTEIYPEFDKLGKQFKYADQRSIPWVIIIGSEEVKNKQISIKNMKSGKQTTDTLESVINQINKIC